MANNDSATVESGSSVSIPVLDEDTDADHAPLTITQVANPAHGVAHVDPSSDTIVYAPAGGFTGTDTFTYTIADPAGVTSTATITVMVVGLTISPPNLPDAEVAAKYGVQLSASGGTAPYTYAVAFGSLPSGLALSASGLFSGTPTVIGVSNFAITVTDSTGLSKQQSFELSVDPTATPPVVTHDPASTTVDAGATATFEAAASGTPTPMVQWQVSTDSGKTFHAITGATSTQYSFPVQPAEDANQYEAVFTNSDGTATSTAATLTVHYSPVVTTQPASQEVVAGTLATFSAAALGDPASIGVQWQMSTDGGATFSNIGGATSPILNVTATISEDEDEYQAVFTNTVGSTKSQPAILRVPAVVATPLPLNSFASFPVSWQDQTNPSDAGGELFDVFVSVNGGAWTPWLTKNAATTATYSGGLGQSIAFYAQADGATNAPPPFAEAQTVTPLWQRALPSEPENTTTGSGVTLASLLQGDFSDADPNPRPAVAVSAATGNGTWQFNNGSAWTNLASVAPVQARLLPQGYRVRFLPAPGWTGEADLLFNAWDGSLGTAGGTLPINATGGGTPFSVNAGEATVQVTSTGTAPAWTAAGITLAPVLPGVSASAAMSIASTFAALFSGGTGTVGIAVTGLGSTMAGTWQYSLDGGTTWPAFGTVSASNARLLSGTDLIRFVPLKSFAGTVALIAHAWDGTGNTDGATANLARNAATGGNSDFSSNTLTAHLAVNHAPGLSATTGPTLPAVVANTTGAATTVSKLLTSASDRDPGTRVGAAIVGASGPGLWQFRLGAGSWLPLGSVSEATALLLPASAQLRFLPTVDQTGSAGLTYRAWDQTAGTPGTLFSVTTTGGAASISAAEATATLTVTPAPPGPTWLSTHAMLTPVLPFPSQSSGDTVAAIFGALFADPNTNAGVGIAVTGMTGTSQGVWQYQLAGSATWTTIPTASMAKAFLLAGNDRVRFVPSKGVHGTFTLQALAWDGTGTHGTAMNLAGAGKIGAGTHFSATTASALVLVNTAPVLRLTSGT